MEHVVKSWPHLFGPIVAGIKTHDLRKRSDRDYKIGDTLRLQEYDMATGKYTGREQIVEITYITSADTPCALSSTYLDKDCCVLSIKKIDNAKSIDASNDNEINITWPEFDNLLDDVPGGDDIIRKYMKKMYERT